MDAAAVNGCLSEVKAAIAGLEAATLASLRSSDLRLNEAQTFASTLLQDSCHAAEEQAQANKRRLEEAEARILRLEDKLMSKRSEISHLRDLAVKMKEKLAQKSEALLAIGETDGSKRPETVKPDPTSAMVAVNGRERETSLSPPGAKEKSGQERRREAGGEADAHGSRRRGSAREHGRESSPDEAGGGRNGGGPDDMSHSYDSSPDEPRESRRRGATHHAKDRGRPRSRSRRSRAGREQSSHSPEGGGRRHHARSRDRRSHDSRGRRATDLHEADRGESSSRSRSRRPWHSSSRGGKGKGKGAGKESALCIPFVFGKCVWGDRCRERHPDEEDARLAKESLQSKVCRFGVDCKRKDCVFRHPQGRKRDQDES